MFIHPGITTAKLSTWQGVEVKPVFRRIGNLEMFRKEITEFTTQLSKKLSSNEKIGQCFHRLRDADVSLNKLI